MVGVGSKVDGYEGGISASTAGRMVIAMARKNRGTLYRNNDGRRKYGRSYQPTAPTGQLKADQHTSSLTAPRKAGWPA
jgi:hypothetical protein